MVKFNGFILLRFNVAVVWRCVFILCLALAAVHGCAWVAWDTDAGRIVFRNSLAKVGPLEHKVEQPVPEALTAAADVVPHVPNKSSTPLADDVVLGNDAVDVVAPLSPAPLNSVKHKGAKVAAVSEENTEPAAKKLYSPKPSIVNHKPGRQAPASVAPIQMPVVAQQALSGVHGQVVVRDENRQVISISGAFVRLYRADGVPLKSQRPSDKTHSITMLNKSYSPRYVSIAAGESVYFSNLDKIKHNVFSSSGENAFDLGTYGSGLRRQVTLAAPGVVKVYCNIHPQMATFIAIDDGAIVTIAETQTGLFALEGVPPGEYLLKVWHVRGKKEIPITLRGGNTENITVELDTGSFVVTERKNKFGEKYKNNAAIFDDEFY